MRKRQQLVDALCLPHCSFYKPGTNEELLCRGAVIVEQLLAAGLDTEPAADTAADRSIEDELELRLCTQCAFREKDCDHAADRSAAPCGGYLLLAKLASGGVIAIEDVGMRPGGASARGRKR